MGPVPPFDIDEKEKFQKRPAMTAGRFYFYVTIY